MLEKHLTLGDGVLDIGANVGLYSKKYAAAVGPTGYVLAVEPDHDSCMVARENNAATPWVTVMHVAVTDAMGPTTLYIDAGDHKRNSLWKANVVDDGGETRTVHTVTLDHLAKLVPNLRGIKIDAQGAEGLILAGGPETLKRADLTWYVELWPQGLLHAGSSYEAVIQMFSAAGWKAVHQSWDTVRALCERQKHPHSSIDVLVTR
jgi:FkbM family methyltransferase